MIGVCCEEAIFLVRKSNMIWIFDEHKADEEVKWGTSFRFQSILGTVPSKACVGLVSNGRVRGSRMS